MIHQSCDDLADMMRNEIINLERIIKAYRSICEGLHLSEAHLDKIEDDAYNSK